jgi:acetolactate synthase-1/2/3 large subunit
MVNRQIHPIGVDIYTPDFQMLAKGFGCEAVKVTKLTDLPSALQAAAKRKTATVIELMEEDFASLS